MEYSIGRIGRSYNIILDFAEDIQTEIEKIIKHENIQNGVVCSGLGGFSDYSIKCPQIESDKQKTMEWKNTIIQLSSLQGTIIDGTLKLYSVISLDAEKPDTFAGENMSSTKRKFYCQIALWEILGGGYNV